MASSDSSGPCCESRNPSNLGKRLFSVKRKDDKQQGTRAIQVAPWLENDPNGRVVCHLKPLAQKFFPPGNGTSQVHILSICR